MDRVRSLGEITVCVHRRGDPVSTDGDALWKQVVSTDRISEKAMKGRALSHEAGSVRLPSSETLR